MRNKMLLGVTMPLLAILVLGVGQAGATSIVDLINTNSGSIPTLQGTAQFVWVDTGSTGTGVIQSFVRINPGGSANFEQGYNTDARPVQFDENTSPSFTHSLSLSSVPVVNLNGTDYREFLLDINQTKADPFLTMVGLQVWLRGAPDLTGFSGNPTTGSFDSGLKVWGMSTGDMVNMDFSRNPGSGYGDVFVYIPDSLFTGSNQYVYLYSAFGTNGSEPPYQTNDGFEEWAVRAGGTPQVPEPGSLLLLGSGIVGLAVLRRVRK